MIIVVDLIVVAEASIGHSRTEVNSGGNGGVMYCTILFQIASTERIGRSRETNEMSLQMRPCCMSHCSISLAVTPSTRCALLLHSCA